jgi:hypothetical protein
MSVDTSWITRPVSPKLVRLAIVVSAIAVSASLVKTLMARDQHVRECQQTREDFIREHLI